jgi:hypothetical protein
MLSLLQKHPVLVFVSVLLLSLAAIGFVWHRLPLSRIGFQFYTGVELPPDVQPVAHASAMDDNFFHTTHFWVLSGTDSAFKGLAKSFCLERSDEDALWLLTILNDEFGINQPTDDVLEGYEGSCTGGRDRWLMDLGPENGAIFSY